MRRRILSGFVCFCFVWTSVWGSGAAYAAEIFLPSPSVILSTSPDYVPAMMRGLRIHADNPLLFDFIIDTGNSGMKLDSSAFKAESDKLIKYFLAALTIKEDDLWVNLSPYEKDRMMTDELGATLMGRDMLAQDYVLKLMTASMIYPEKELGKAFWDKVYAQAKERFGTAAADIPVDTFNKVWITADRAKVLERNGAAYVVGAHLKVMLESDYLAQSRHSEARSAEESPVKPGYKLNDAGGPSLPSGARDDVSSIPSSTQELSKQVLREIVLPAIEKEVNEGKNFANLRQIYHAMILTSWYKTALKDALLNQVYADQGKVNGVQNDDPAVKEKIYEQYLETYKKGVFNYIKEETDAATGEAIPHKYFSGGLKVFPHVVERARELPAGEAIPGVGDSAMVVTQMDRSGKDRAMGPLSLKFSKMLLSHPAATLTATVAAFLATHSVAKGDTNSFPRLYEKSRQYVRLFETNALTTGFPGLTRSFQGYVPAGQNTDTERYGASSYDLSGLARIQLRTNNTAILDTMIANWSAHNDIMFNYNSYHDANNNPVRGIPYEMIRILGRGIPDWWNAWNWNVDQGASAEWIEVALEAYSRTGNVNYRNFATGLMDALLPLQATNGGFRFGPIGIWHPSGTSFYWNLQSTEKNQRIFYALQNLISVTNDTRYVSSLGSLKTWLRSMYNKTEHVFHTSAEWNGYQWVPSPLGGAGEYFATDVTAMAPLEWMLTDSYFGATPEARAQEIDDMFEATELRTGFTDFTGAPVWFYKFSTTQMGDYGTVEWSSQMALAYLKAAQLFHASGDQEREKFYSDRYRILVFSLKDNFFFPASSDPTSKVAPYASYEDGSVAGGVSTGTGIDSTPFSEAALVSSAWFGLASAGFYPGEIDGGVGNSWIQPVITSIQAPSGSQNVTLTIQDPVGVTAYNIYSTDSLGGNFSVCATNVSTTGTGTTAWTDTRTRASGQRFYTVRGDFAMGTAQMSSAVVSRAAVASAIQQRDTANAVINGGIDLNAKNMALDVERKGAGIQMKVDPALLQQFQKGDFSGVTPVILQITPISGPVAVLGLQEKLAGMSFEAKS